MHLKANEAHSVYVEFCNVRGPADGDEDETVMDANPGVRLGGAEVRDPDTQMEEAVRLASEADVVIAVVGLNADWETEGYDRPTLSLPGRTDELIQKVSQANTKTIVVTESVRLIVPLLPFHIHIRLQGSSITMPWAQSVAAIVHSWYLGNATGDAIADILFGTVNPSGKLSLTFPKREADLPSFGHFNSEDGKVHYAEDLFVVSTIFVIGIDTQCLPCHYRVINITCIAALRLSSPSGEDISNILSILVYNIEHHISQAWTFVHHICVF